MMRRSHLPMLSVALGLLILGGCQAGMPAATVTAIPLSASPTAAPTATSTSTIALSPLPSQTVAPASSPTPPECNADFLLYAGQNNILYRACGDSSSTQEFISLMSWSIDSLTLYDMAISPDGHRLAILSGGGRVFDLTKYAEVASFEPITGKPGHYFSWSPDGQYIGHASVEDDKGQIDIIHLETQTVSELSVALDVVSSQVVDNLSFDWSPNGKTISYVFFVDGKPPTINGYIANIDCALMTHTCEIENEQRLTWVDSWRTLTWTPDSLSLIAGFKDPSAPDRSIIEIRETSGEINRRIDLPDSLEIADTAKAVLSPDGKHIAFFEVSEGIRLFVLDIGTMEYIDIANDVNPSMVLWLPK